MPKEYTLQPSADAAADDTFATLPLASITASLTNPRKHFAQAKLQELADSIAASGVHQPILVRPLPGSRVPDTVTVHYEIVAGERRFRASQLAGASTIPALIRPLTDAQALEVQLVENLQRSDLSEIEEADGYQHLITATGIDRADLAIKIGKSKSYVNARLRLLALCQEARQALADGKMDASRALEIARIPHFDLQAKALAEAIAVNSWDGAHKHSARSFQQWLRQNVMLKLEHAPFSITDTRLVEQAGSCKQCPRRTGADPDIFADVLATDGGADICTDVPCYRAKESAHQARLLKQAEAKGMRVISGAEANELHTYSDNFSDYTPLKETARQHIERSPTPELVRMTAISLLIAADDHHDDNSGLVKEMAKLLQIDTAKLYKQDAALKALRANDDAAVKKIQAELAALAAQQAPEDAPGNPNATSTEGPATLASGMGGGKAKRPGAARRGSAATAAAPKLSPSQAKAGIAAAMQSIEATPPADGVDQGAAAAATPSTADANAVVQTAGPTKQGALP